MRKLIVAMVSALILSLSVSIVALGNSYTLKAENGKLLSPAGLGFDVSTSFSQGKDFNFNSLPVTVKLSYGIRPSISVSGEVDRLDENNRNILLKASYSPSTGPMGYTAYLGYNLTDTEIPMYGVSLWLDSDLLYAFLNLEANRESDQTAFIITPGLNLRIGSRIRLAGEIAYEPNAGNQELRLGASYALVNQLNLKVGFQTDKDNSDRVITTGIAMEL